MDGGSYGSTGAPTGDVFRVDDASVSAVTITVKVGSRTLRLGSVPFAIPAGKIERVSVRVLRATRQRLGRRHALKAIVTIKLLKAGGGATTARLAFTLKR